MLTLGGMIAYFVSMNPVFEESTWRPWLERVSIFKLYNPVELVDAGDTLGFNLAALSAIGRRLYCSGIPGVRGPRSADQRLKD